MARQAWAAAALGAVLLTAGAARADTKDKAIEALREFAAALEAKDYKKAGTFMQGAEKLSEQKIAKALDALIKQKEVSKKGVEILAAKGKWGKLDEVFGADRAKTMAERFKVPPASCYGLMIDSSEAGFYWNGTRFTLIRVNNIGKLE